MITKVIVSVESAEFGIPNKCTRPFSGTKSLLELCIEKMKQLDLPVAVNSASPDALALAARLGVIAQARPVELDDPETAPGEIAQHIAEVNADAELIMLVNCGNPLISLEHYKVALSIPPEKWRGFDSLVSGYSLKKYVWLNKSAMEREPLYPVGDRPPVERIRNLNVVEGSLNLILRARMLELSDCIGQQPAFVLIPPEEVVDIENEIDFAVAKVRYEDQQKPTQERLTGIPRA